MYSSTRPISRLTRTLLIAPTLFGLAGAATIVQPTNAAAKPGPFCDYVAERGVIAPDSMVHYWWAQGHAHGCW